MGGKRYVREAQEMKPYEWMVKYTGQTAWVERRGRFVWLALYVGLLGGGSYLASLYFNNLLGMFVSWLIILVLKTGLHVAHSKNPMKLWRMILRPQTSWISRGLIMVILFIGFGALQLGFSYWLPGTAAEVTLKAITACLAIGIITYEGFAMNYVNGIPFWNSALLPVLFILWGVLTGLALVMVFALAGGSIDMTVVVGGSLVLLAIAVVFVLVYLWSATYMGPTAKQSVRVLTRGYMVFITGAGVVLCGLVIPLAIFLYSYSAGEIPTPWLAVVVVVCEIIGGLALTYALLKAGMHSPLVPIAP
jgi:sulfite dehydrogenase (quinone) subunit SoeC